MRLSWALLAAGATGAAAAAAGGEGADADVLSFNLADHIEEAETVFKKHLSDKDAAFYTLADFEKMMSSSGVNQTLVRLTFQRDDADSDGQATFSEYARWFTRGNLFLQLDGSLPGDERDGRVSREEFLVFVRFCPSNHQQRLMP